MLDKGMMIVASMVCMMNAILLIFKMSEVYAIKDSMRVVIKKLERLDLRLATLNHAQTKKTLATRHMGLPEEPQSGLKSPGKGPKRR